jgi:hypothetical protein
MKTILPKGWAVPKRFHERLGERAGRQRAMVDSGHLLLVLHAPPGARRAEGQARFFWRDAGGAWRSSSLGGGPGALRGHVKDFEDAVEALEARARGADDAQSFFTVLRAAVPLLRTARNLHRALQEARDAVDDKELITLRDRAGDVERALDLLVSEARDGLDFTIAHRAEAQARTQATLAQDSHRLNQIAAMFLPITALASIFSMTLRSGLETTWAPWLFWAIVVAGVLLGLAMRGRPPAPRDVEPLETPARPLTSMDATSP